MAEDSGFAMGYALGQDSGGGGNGGWGGFGDGIWALAVLALLFGRGGFGGFGGGGGCEGNCATQADVRAAVDQQTLISKIDQQTYGLADTFNSLNNTLNSNFRGIDNALCNLGYQTQTGFNGLSSQLFSCCCDLEKANMQNRFDAQTYNCNTLQAIDKLGDRIEGRLSAMETAKLREQLDEERTKNAVLQGSIDRAQLRYDIVNDVRPCPTPAYLTCNPFAASYGYGTGYNSGCGCGCG